MHQRRRPLQSLIDMPARFLEWWGGELWQALPQSMRRFLGGSKPVLVLAVLDNGFRLFEERGGRARYLGPRADTPLTREQALKAIGDAARSGPRRSVGIRIPAVSCYARSTELPAGARKDFEKILRMDLERATPFKLQDVYTAHIIDTGAQRLGKVHVQQLVAKRSIIDPLLADLESVGQSAAFVDCWRDKLSPGLPGDFLPDKSDTARGGFSLTAVKALAAAACVLAILAGYLVVSKYEVALDQLRAETATMKTRAAAVGRQLERSAAAVDDLERLQELKKKQVPALVTLEEVSRILPDSVWLTDLRIEGGTVEILGLAKSGAALPALFEQSKLFAGAALTAPLTLDQREDKERFTLKVRLRQAGGSP